MKDGTPNIVPLRSAPSDLERGEDDQLMALAAAGNRLAFSVLVARYLPRVTQFCLRFSGDMLAAEELTQEVFLEVWLRRERYRMQGRFKVFLFVMTRHRCLNYVRDQGRRDRREQTVPNDAPRASSQLEVLLEKERQRLVQEALLGLSLKLREAALLRFDQGLDYSDVARIIGCSESTARSRVHLAMLALRDVIAKGDAR